MANHKSAIKRARQNAKRNERNRQQRSRLNTMVKKVTAAVSESNPETAQQALGKALRTLDKSASRGLIHKNKAARKKSRLARAVNKLTAGAEPG